MVFPPVAAFHAILLMRIIGCGEFRLAFFVFSWMLIKSFI